MHILLDFDFGLRPVPRSPRLRGNIAGRVFVWGICVWLEQLLITNLLSEKKTESAQKEDTKHFIHNLRCFRSPTYS